MTEARPEGLRILVIGQGRPVRSGDPRDVLAYEHFRTVRDRPGFRTIFLAGVPGQREPLRQVATDEYSCSAPVGERFFHSNLDVGLRDALRRLAVAFRPERVHLFDGHGLGIELIEVIKAQLPEVELLLSLSAFDILCAHDGSMAKRPSLAPCGQAAPQDCQLCFPNVRQADLLLRQIYDARFVKLADRLVVRSHAGRRLLARHGFDQDRITVFRPIREAVEPAGQRDTKALRLKLSAVLTGFGGPAMLARAMAAVNGGPPLSRPIVIDASATVDGDILRLTEGTPGRNVRFAAPADPPVESDLLLVPQAWNASVPIAVEQALARGQGIVCGEHVAELEGLERGRQCLTFVDGDPQALGQLLAAAAEGRVPPGTAGGTEATLHTLEQLYGV